MKKLSLKKHFDNGELENLPTMVQEAANYCYSIGFKYADAVNVRNQRIADGSGWFSDEISNIESPSIDNIYDYIEENEVDLAKFDKQSRDDIRYYATQVLKGILKNDKE